MTIVTIYKSNGSYKGFECKGHAGYAKSGSDIVCAAISVLVINTINSIEELAKEEMAVENDSKTGFISCRFLNEINEKSKLLMESMILGLKSIVKEYVKAEKNQYLKLIFEEV